MKLKEKPEIELGQHGKCIFFKIMRVAKKDVCVGLWLYKK